MSPRPQSVKLRQTRFRKYPRTVYLLRHLSTTQACSRLNCIGLFRENNASMFVVNTFVVAGRLDADTLLISYWMWCHSLLMRSCQGLTRPGWGTIRNGLIRYPSQTGSLTAVFDIWLRQFSLLKPEGCKHRPITLPMHKLSIFCPIRRCCLCHPSP